MVNANQQWDIVTSVGATALGVAAARAVETGRDDALIHDRFAEAFVRAAEPSHPLPTSPQDPAAAEGFWPSMADFLAVRSRYFDDYCAEASRSGIRQLVLLAAGLDTRPFRLDWPDGTRIFEVDQPQVLVFKDQVLAAQGARASFERHVVDTDLRDDWPGALATAGFDPSAPTAWLVEGLAPYLPAAAEQELFAEIDRLSAPGSRVGVEWVHDLAALLDEEKFRSSADLLGVDLTELWNTEPRVAADERLTGLGWAVRSEPLAEAGARYGRSFDAERAHLIGKHGRLGTARR